MWGSFCLLMVFSGCVIGRHTFYAHQFPIISMEDRQVYEGVSPSKDPMFFSDAGLIYFSEGARVDASMFRSFQFQGTDFCAAPILDGGSHAGFFAIGTDCCKGAFDCGSGLQGIVLHRYEQRLFAPPDQHEYFLIAAAAVAETFGLTLRENSIFVSLTKDAMAQKQKWQSRVFGYTLLPSLVSMFVCLFVCTALIICFRRKLRNAN